MQNRHKQENRQKRIWQTLIVLVLLIGAFVLGTFLSAAANNAAPGSVEDPLVSESYVQSKVAALEARIQSLEKELAIHGAQVSGMAPESASSASTLLNPGSEGSNSEAPETTETSARRVYTKAGNSPINIRTTPSLQGPVQQKVAPGTGLTWLRTSGEWYEVELANGQSGWVHNSVSELR